MLRALDRALLAALLTTTGLLASACEGPVGPPGDPGPPGPPGPPGALPDAASSSTDGGVLPDGGELRLEPEGLVGFVHDTAGAPLVGARVVLVPAADVAALGGRAVDPTLPPAEAARSDADEPLEDLLAAPAASAYPAALTDGRGLYRFVSLSAAPMFVVVVPASDDDVHLPGGELASAARDPTSLVGQQVDLRVSTRPGDDATHVGSASCVRCHGRHRAFGTAHFAGLSVPGRRGYLQDTSRWPAFDAALARFEAGITLYFHDCRAGGEPACTVSEADPGPAVDVSFMAVLSRDPAVPLGETGAYRVRLENRDGSDTASFPLELTYGGALGRQVFVVPVPRAGGVERHVLPFQWQEAGAATSGDPRARPWRDVGSADWYSTDRLRTPASDRSFDASCAGCHFTGFELEGDAASGFRASALTALEGPFDYDLDGRREEIHVGCEGCHGPGSEHVEAGGRGIAIVSPALLTPERSVALCARCHSRAGGSAGRDAPLLDADGRLAPAGIARAELIARFHDRPEAIAGDLFVSGDPARDRLAVVSHVGSPMHRNGRALTRCQDCHDVHGTSEPHDLRAPLVAGTGCTSCHGEPEYTTALGDHLLTATGDAHLVPRAELSCAGCHMPHTATGGAPILGLRDALPSGVIPVQYWQGDSASHRYLSAGFDLAASQPTSVTQTCGICHAASLPNP